jgi:hypothetical protein
MKKIYEMNTIELAAFVSDYLRKNGVENVLTGGSCAEIYSSEKYVSGDLDIVDINYVSLKKITEILEGIGFKQLNQSQGFVHPQAVKMVEILNAPLSVGEEKIETVDKLVVAGYQLNILTPTDSVKDRLAAYYHWNDRQSLEVALMICEKKEINIAEVRRWSEHEGMEDKFKFFKEKYDLKKQEIVIPSPNALRSDPESRH